MEMQSGHTRAELKRTEGAREVAVRGHRILRDKRDELARRFMELIGQAVLLRRQVSESVARSLGQVYDAAEASAAMSVLAALLVECEPIGVRTVSERVMGVELEKILADAPASVSLPSPDMLMTTPPELDEAISSLTALRDDLLKLASVESSVIRLADELERLRRRVGALEFIVIPNYSSKIHAITERLDELERGESARVRRATQG